MLATIILFSLLETRHLQSLEEVLGTARSALVLLSSRPALDSMASLIIGFTFYTHSLLILLCLFKLLLEIVDRTSVRNVLLGGDVEFLLQLLDILFEVLYFDLKSRDLFSLDPSLANLAL